MWKINENSHLCMASPLADYFEQDSIICHLNLPNNSQNSPKCQVSILSTSIYKFLWNFPSSISLHSSEILEKRHSITFFSAQNWQIICSLLFLNFFQPAKYQKNKKKFFLDREKVWWCQERGYFALCDPPRPMLRANWMSVGIECKYKSQRFLRNGKRCAQKNKISQHVRAKFVMNDMWLITSMM